MRPDIDGLRSIAVLPVVLFHAGVPYFSGGFVGVDVFFVISGYLITGILYREMSADRFSFVTFYERRIRRILPALYVLMAAVLLGSWLMFLPKDLNDTGQSLLATAIYLSNFLFYIKTSYFGSAADTKPLLHTWSLSVEEQFYIFFPLVLWLIMRFARHATAIILGTVAVSSFLLSVWAARHYPVENFYFPFTRAWELILGSLLAVAWRSGTFSRLRSEICSWAGLAMIIASVLLLSEHSTFPGVTALPVCLGTALIIGAGTQGQSHTVAKLLGLRPLVFTGLISYSLYLWHWPVIVFTSYYFLEPPTGPWLIGLLAAIYALSALSWRFIEQPVRLGQVFRSRSALFSAALAGAAGFSVIGGGLYLSNGVPARLRTDVTKMEQWRFTGNTVGCDPAPGAIHGAQCKIGTGVPRFIVWGDSHSISLRPAFERAANNSGVSGLVVSANACGPLVGLEFEAVARQQNDCRAFNNQVLRLIDELEIESVFLAARWRSYTPAELLRNGTFEGGLETTLRALRGRKVYIIHSVPGARAEVAPMLARAKMFNRQHKLELTLGQVERERRQVSAVFRDMQRRHKVALLDPAKHLCSAKCMVEHRGMPLYSDSTHLTPAATQFLAPTIETLLRADLIPNAARP